MTLYNFVNETRRSITMFLEEWVENNEKNPEHYPIEMDEPDWDEQFHLMWVRKSE